MNIFDLDKTLIDSSHRTVKALKNGEFCLKTYIADCNTPELINKDSLLPLAKYAQMLIRVGQPFAVMTARYMTEVDREFLIRNGLINHDTILMGRDSVSKEIRALSDVDYKLYQFKRLQAHFNTAQHFVMFDDMPDIIKAFGELDSVTSIDAVALNSALGDCSQLTMKTSDTISAFIAFNQSNTRDQFDAFITDAGMFAV
jgi:phosphoglycolate phosphatase-like HAD superfamily hydrolase